MNAPEHRAMIVTGASSGIGRALALRAGRAGFAILAVGRREEALREVASAIVSGGGTADAMVADVGDVRTAPQIVARALERLGRIDVVVNNAGFASVGDLSQQTDAALAAQFATHVLGPLALTREALPALQRTGGHVLFVGSGVARVPVGTLGAYPSAKAALRSATATLRRELAREGIAVTYVDPGVVDTDFMRRAGMPGAPARILVTPEEVARKILHAVRTRQRVLNAVPWQTALVALAELFPRVTDTVLERAPQLVGGGDTPAAVLAEVFPPSDEAPPTPSIPSAPSAPSGVSAALAPLARRMERLNLGEAFVRGLLVPGTRLELGDVALRWAGMPNKNERAVTAEVLGALAEAGYLEPAGDGAWTVVKAPD